MTIQWTSDLEDIEHEENGFEINPDRIKTLSLEPQQISPIALRTLVINLDPTYPAHGMTVDDFSVTLVPVELELTYLTINNEGIRPLNVIAVDDVEKSITVKYGGAYSGTYDLLIKSQLHGNVDTSATQLEVVFEINHIFPLYGSVYGGAKLTITGGPFTEDINETFVKVRFQWWDGIDHYCYVIAVWEDKVICRLPLDLNREPKAYEVIAFSSTYEEANCEFSQCLFQFVAANELPEVTSFSISYDSNEEAYMITVQGTDFTDAAEDIEFFLNDAEQTVVEATATSVKIRVDEV